MLCVVQAAARAGFHVSNWLLDIVLTMLVHHTFLGFELEVYAPFEYTADATRGTRLATRNRCNTQHATRPVACIAPRESRSSERCAAL